MVEAESGERIVTMTGGLDLWPADAAIPQVDYVDSLDRRGRPVRAARRRRGDAPLAAVAARRDVAAMWQRQGGLADPFKGTRRIAASPGPTGRRCATGRRSRPPRRRRRRGGGGDRGVTHRAGRVVVAADAWTNELLAPFERRLPLDGHQGAGHLLRRPDPAAFAPTGSRSGSGWTTRRSTASPPTARPVRRPPRTAAAGRSTRTGGRSSATRPPTPRVAALHGPPSAGGARPADLHQDLPVHAHPGPRLRGRPGPRGAGRHRRPGRRPRVQVRLGARPDRGRDGAGRGTPSAPETRAIPASIGPSCSRRRPRRPGWCSA